MKGFRREKAAGRKEAAGILRRLLPGLLVFFVFLAAGTVGRVLAEVRPQFGFEAYGGANKLFIASPWTGIRFGLGGQASLILRYHYHGFRYDYYGSDGGGGTVLKAIEASINRFSGTVYFAGEKLSGYINFSYLTGSEEYRGYLLDSGLEYKLNPRISALWSVYTIREKSVLWHPEEQIRWINTYSVRFGARFWLAKSLIFNPNIYLIENSENVEAVAYSVGLVFSPRWWLALHAYYFRYGETAFYIFRGNYFSAGLNFYF